MSRRKADTDLCTKCGTTNWYRPPNRGRMCRTCMNNRRNQKAPISTCRRCGGEAPIGKTNKRKLCQPCAASLLRQNPNFRNSGLGIYRPKVRP